MHITLWVKLMRSAGMNTGNLHQTCTSSTPIMLVVEVECVRVAATLCHTYCIGNGSVPVVIINNLAARPLQRLCNSFWRCFWCNSRLCCNRCLYRLWWLSSWRCYYWLCFNVDLYSSTAWACAAFTSLMSLCATELPRYTPPQKAIDTMISPQKPIFCSASHLAVFFFVVVFSFGILPPFLLFSSLRLTTSTLFRCRLAVLHLEADFTLY